MSFRHKYDFKPDVLDVIIGGKSSIDSTAGFRVETLDEADRFVRSYGYNLENPIERAEIHGNFQEAMNFIRKHFLQPDNPSGLKLDVPRRLAEITDVRELFLVANFKYPGQMNDTPGALMRNWACSVLKVMHTIAHIDKDVRTAYFADIQKQIFDRFYREVHRDEEGRLYLGAGPDDPLRVSLVAFETKEKKSRDSMLIKLLHKPENVAEDIFDRVGTRFVTPTRLDALRVVKYLKDKLIVMPPNIKPSRSRNNLLNLEHFRSTLPDLLGRLDQNQIEEEEFKRELERSLEPSENALVNPHSSEFYRAIQFTCRQLIKLTNPLYDELRELKTLHKAGEVSGAAAKVVDRIELKNIQREIRFFYPFEVQVVDRLSAEENQRGRSAHVEYKKSQQQTAMKRVMAWALTGPSGNGHH